ncbi:MAG TPA: hypothetical protein DD415_01780 [Clostridiales bacterium]|nr:hypothetical protein [Clostridiales bacterium]
MKKVIAAVCSALLIVVMAFAFTGCNVEGNTYIYDSYTLSYDKSDLTDSEKKEIDNGLDVILSPLKLIKYEFKADGVVSVSGIPGKYTQDGNDVTVNSIDKFTASGSKLKKVVKKDTFSLTVIYKKA